MGQPNPPGDLPLIEGLSAEWNDFVSAIPEDKRAELAPKFKERISGYESRIKDYEPWDQFSKAGVTPDQVDTSLRLWSAIETSPKDVYEAIGKSLGITPAEAKEVIKEVEKGNISNDDDPRYKALQDQMNTMAQVMLAERQMSAQEQQAAEQDAAIEQELNALKKKYGDFPEDEIIMRMYTKNLTAEQAFEEYNTRVSEIQKRRPAPMIMGQGGSIPSNAIDPRKLDSKATKSLVAQMLDHANAETR